MSSSSDYLLEWFNKRSSVPGGTIEQEFTQNYFQAGLIDSFGVIELIGDIESDFGIRFTEQHFQDRRFATIGGLAEIICELRRDT